MKYNPGLPWFGYGSPCGPCNGVEFPDLADCQECEMCGGCEIHEGCTTDLNHIEWFLRFASLGESACGNAGSLSGRATVCALIAGHGGEWHQERGGAGWPVVPARRKP